VAGAAGFKLCTTCADPAQHAVQDGAEAELAAVDGPMRGCGACRGKFEELKGRPL